MTRVWSGGQWARVFLILLNWSLALSAQPDRGLSGSQVKENVVVFWDNATLDGIRALRMSAPVAARSLAIVHTCMYDAWAAYDERANGTEFGGALRRPQSDRNLANKRESMSYAAYNALIDLMPTQSSAFATLLGNLGYDSKRASTDINTPEGLGTVACAAVLEFRHHDGSNQLGDLAPGPYQDWTGFVPKNRPNMLVGSAAASDPNLWQPLLYTNADGDLVSQRFREAHWCRVVPFALLKGDQFRLSRNFEGPAKLGSSQFQEEAEELIEMSANLTDRQKVIAEYWKDGPRSEQPPGHWALFAQFVSSRDKHSLDQDAEMFFALSNAMFDAGIAAWDLKLAYNSVRPITAIPALFRGKTIKSWAGPGMGAVEMDGANWRPYQPATDPTPSFPEYVSGHSAFSAAAARILANFTASDRFGASARIGKGTSKIEPGLTPPSTVELHWATFYDAADEAGISRRYGGIHFRTGDLAGRKLGRLVADAVWKEVQCYFDGSIKPTPAHLEGGSHQ